MSRFVVAVLAALWALPAGAQAPSVETLQRRLISESLAPALESVAAELESQPVAVRAELGRSGANALLSGYASLLLERGYEVFELRGQQTAPEGSLVLELQPTAVGISYGAVQRGFLGLGAGRVPRHAVLDLTLRVLDADSGQLLYEERRALERDDWVPVEDRVVLAPGDPFYVAQGPGSNSAGSVAPQVGWLERGIALGLLSGVIIVYFSASS